MLHLLPTIFRTTLAVLEMDFSGTIAAVGPSSNLKERGLEPVIPVFSSITVLHHLKGIGALAEFIVLDAATVVRVPAPVESEEGKGADIEGVMWQAAGLGVAGCTALELLKHAGLKRGDAVLVNGASGGIRHLVVQMCRQAVGESGRVVGVCSGGNAEMVRGLGADEVSQDWNWMKGRWPGK